MCGEVKVKKLEIIISCTLFLALTIIISRGLIFSPGVISHHDWPIPPYRQQILQDFPAGFFSAWQNGVDTTVNSRGQLMLGLSNRLISLIFSINGEQLSKIYLILTMWFSGFGMCFVGRAFKKSWSSSFVAGVFYMLTPWLFDRIVAGDFSRMFAYMLYPLIFYLFTRSINSRKDKNGDILYSVLIGILLLLIDNVAFVVVFATLTFYSIFRSAFSNNRKKEIFTNMKSLVTIFSIFSVSNLCWIVPSLLSSQNTNILSFASISDIIVRSQNSQIIDVVRCMGSPLRWFLDSVSKNGTLYPIWTLASFLIPIIAFSALIFRPKDKNVIFFSLLAIVSLFLGKGLNSPFGQVYLWAYLNIPYMQIFRDPNKWVMVVSFAFSFLILCSVDLLISHAQRIRWPFSIKAKTPWRVNFGKVCSVSVVLMLLTTFFVFSAPFLSGDFNGQLKAVDFPNSYQAVTQWLGNQSGDFKVLWLPPDLYTQYDWIGSSSYQQRDLIAMYSLKPNLMMYSSSEMGRLSYFIASTLYNNATSTCYLSKILAIADVKYVLLRNDAEGWWWRNLDWTRDKLNFVMQNQLGLKLIKEFGAVDVYLNQYYADQKIVATNDVMLISGGFSSLISLFYLESTHRLYPLFVEQIPQNSIREYTKYTNSIVIKDGDFSSFIFSFVPQQYIINPSNYAIQGDKATGWATLYGSDYWWIQPYYLDSVMESAITSTNVTLSMPFSSSNYGQYKIWIKSFWDTNLHLIVSINGAKIGEITSKNFDTMGYSWIEVNSTILKPGNHEISIQNNGSMSDEDFSKTLVSSIAIVPEEVMEEATASAINAVKAKSISLVSEAEMTRIADFSSSWALNGSFGLNASQGLAITSKAYSPIPYSIFVPKSGNYDVYLRVNSPQISNVTVSIENKDIYGLLNPSNNFVWFNLTTQYLSQGEHVLQIAADIGVSVDLMMLKSVDNPNDADPVNIGVSYIKNSPTKYLINTEFQGPLFLFFSEPYNAGWKAYVNGTEVDSVPICSGFNLFLLNENMTGTITIEFAKQKYFEVGLYVGLVVISAMVAFCVYEVLKRRFLKNANLLCRFR